MPKVGGVLETSLYVNDLERSVKFYQSVFGFEPLFSDDRLCALSVADRQVLLLFKKGASAQALRIAGGIIPPSDGEGQLHVAFTISPDELESWERQLKERDIQLESRVRWERGGESLYFRDPDRHLIELVTPGCWAIDSSRSKPTLPRDHHEPEKAI